jgi:hypothetical protein
VSRLSTVPATADTAVAHRGVASLGGMRARQVACLMWNDVPCATAVSAVAETLAC